MPYKDKNIFFMNYHKQLITPFLINADFECLTLLIKEEYRKQIVTYQEYKACGYGYKIVCQHDNKYSKPYQGYSGENDRNFLEEQKEIKKNN